MSTKPPAPTGLRRVTSTIEFRWHAPFLTVAAALAVVSFTAGLPGLLYPAVLLTFGAGLSLTFMRIGARSLAAQAKLLAEHFPHARHHADVMVSRQDQRLLGLPGDRHSLHALLVVTDDGLLLVDHRSARTLVALPWETIQGASSAAASLGSTPLEAVDLHLGGQRVVRLTTLDVRTVLGNAVILARPDSKPWPAP